MAKQMTYEQAMARLGEIVGALESGEESLESSMRLFEEGAKLSAFCYEELEQAQQKVTQLSPLPEEEAHDL